jgi:hypothetical protein
MNADGIILRFDMSGLPYLLTVEMRNGIGICVKDTGDKRSINHLTLCCDSEYAPAVRKAVESYNRVLTEEMTNAK